MHYPPCMLGSPILTGLCILAILTTLLVIKLYYWKNYVCYESKTKRLKVKKRSKFRFLMGMEP